MMLNKSNKNKELAKLVAATIIVGVACAVLGDTLKLLTEHYETIFYNLAVAHPVYYFVFPIIGFYTIYILRFYLFNNKENKGIKEVLNSIKTRHNELPVYKIPSHFINGLITVISGGSTGIEVSTVVASGSVGLLVHNKIVVHPKFRTELIAAGVAAGVAILFNSPIAGALFALEVILEKKTKLAIISILVAVGTVWLFTVMVKSKPLFEVTIDHYNNYAFPYFVLLGVFSGLNSVYLTTTVLFFKAKFSLLSNNHKKIFLGAFIISLGIFIFPQLYGEGYNAIGTLIASPQQLKFSYKFVLTLIGILILKPIVTSATLAAGGDGGVFAPSLFVGAFLGLTLALILNLYFKADVLPINFMVVGMAAVLSASIHAPFTALFLVCGLINNYTLLLPILIACIVATFVAKRIIPYTVYSYTNTPVLASVP